MALNQFADVSRDLFKQIRVVETLIKGDMFKEARKLLPAAEEACNNLEQLMEPDNRIQRNIMYNRRREVSWIQDSIRQSNAKAGGRPTGRASSKK